jgi:hypothetical protein
MSPGSAGVGHEAVGILLGPLVNGGDHLPDRGRRLRELPAEKECATAIAYLGLAGWELVNVYHDMRYFKREK